MQYIVKLNVKNIDKAPREGSTDTWQDRDIDVTVEAENETAAPAAGLAEYYRIIGKTEADLPRAARPRVRAVSAIEPETVPVGVAATGAAAAAMVTSNEDGTVPVDLDGTDAVDEDEDEDEDEDLGDDDVEDDEDEDAADPA